MQQPQQQQEREEEEEDYEGRLGMRNFGAERMDFCTDVDLTQFLLLLVLVLVFFFSAILAEL